MAYDHHPVSDCCHPVCFSGQRDHDDAFHTRHHKVQERVKIKGLSSFLTNFLFFYNDVTFDLFPEKS